MENVLDLEPWNRSRKWNSGGNWVYGGSPHQTGTAQQDDPGLHSHMARSRRARSPLALSAALGINQKKIHRGLGDYKLLRKKVPHEEASHVAERAEAPEDRNRELYWLLSGQ
eukprot:CAMPEP_0183359674 /NCGR_PEP_ID=MMETSP0164_2-20130417/52981_1 /TAXON_ID=221442 /ORGANISM="Coccolithus pelagicus ssp braarudi, Strain PLY182g" /LENGTH=111 /DNA_ID=CAMNT_0025533851 /DNA_START=444 /DNA_END=780 /DNA_ORIENTATION=+